jgi:hypothetical protein
MKKFMLTIMLTTICAGTAFAQAQTSGAADASSSASLSRNDKSLNIESGTRLAAQLENTLDVRKARVGDRVVLRATEAIKENGRTILKKGSRLVGRVTDVQQRGRGRADSSVSLLFDRLESGSLATPITATINSITQVRARSSSSSDGMSADSDIRSTSSGRASQPQRSGGLLSGVTNTVGGVVDTTTQTVDGTLNAAGQTVGNTVGAIRIEQSSSADVQGGTTLSLSGDNLRLEKGATFHLTLNQSTDVRGNR